MTHKAGPENLTFVGLIIHQAVFFCTIRPKAALRVADIIDNYQLSSTATGYHQCSSWKCTGFTHQVWLRISSTLINYHERSSIIINAICYHQPFINY